MKKIKTIVRNLLPRTLRQHYIVTGPLMGRKIVTSWYDYPAAILGYTEKSLLGWLFQNATEGQTWLDIGAHYGYTAIALSRIVGVYGRVFAFEPMLSTSGYLAQTRKINHLGNLTVIPFALGDVTQLTLSRFPTVRGMADSTLINQPKNERGIWYEQIIVAGLDWLWPQICDGVEQIDGVKIDVQGMEISVLRGMVNLLKTYKPKLVIELHSGVNRAEFLDLLRQVGYSRRPELIEPIPGEIEPQLVDDHSYAFIPIS